jgi:hypothetical protein
VNIRSFAPDRPKGQEFQYGLRDVKTVLSELRRLARSGLYTIVNETIDVMDGGVSGVVQGDIVEFAPGDTPRCVEGPGTVALPRHLAMRLLSTVYGFVPALDHASNLRVEFSLHPRRRGIRHDHTVVWEVEELASHQGRANTISWPNKFSELVGDKAFGLLVAELVGIAVPATTVISRNIAPFAFGRPTGTGERWIRTAPRRRAPGRFATVPSWTDPFRLLQEEDPDSTALASVLVQEGVNPAYSGAILERTEGRSIVEGVVGPGDRFMLGQVGPQPLPDEVVKSVLDLESRVQMAVGNAAFEWVYDGTLAWVVQLHRTEAMGVERTIVPGSTSRFHRFDVRDGLDALRVLVDRVEGSGDGVILVGDVGITSHFGDILRQANIPSRVDPQEHNQRANV